MLYKLERLQDISNLIRTNGSVSVKELAVKYQVSEATIRSDLTQLEKDTDIERTHGGAIYFDTNREPSITDRLDENNIQKKAIAFKALEKINNGETILIDTGTTMLALARALVDSRLTSLTIFSNDIEVIRILEAREDFELHLLGGTIRNGFHYCYGYQVFNELGKLHFDKLFLSTSAISFSNGFTTANATLAQIKSTMISISKYVIMLADSSKMNQVHLRKFADFKDITLIIMDNSLTPESIAQLYERIPNAVFV